MTIYTASDDNPSLLPPKLNDTKTKSQKLENEILDDDHESFSWDNEQESENSDSESNDNTITKSRKRTYSSRSDTQDTHNNIKRLKTQPDDYKHDITSDSSNQDDKNNNDKTLCQLTKFANTIYNDYSDSDEESYDGDSETDTNDNKRKYLCDTRTSDTNISKKRKT